MRCRPSAVDREPEQGSAVVDFVLVMVLLIPIVMGIVQVGLVLHVRNTLTAAASDGARAGSPIGAGPDDAAQRTRELVSAALADRFASDVSAREISMDGVPVVKVVIVADVPALGDSRSCGEPPS